MAKTAKGKPKLLELLSLLDVALVRYVKIRGRSNPFDSNDQDYFAMRRKAKNYRLLDGNSFTAGLSLKKG